MYERKVFYSFLCGLNTGVRLGYAVDAVREMGISWQYWLRDCILHQRVKCNRNYLGPFASVLHSVVLSSLSYDEISRKLKEYNPNQMICPNIIVSASNLYADKVWEWIKIGDVIINNTQPLVVWPKEGEQSEVIRLFGLGINCQVYLPGCVKLNDNVYLHIPKSEEEMKSKENITEESNVTQHNFKKHPNNSPKQIYDVLNTLELSNLIWVKVGKVSNMYIYPLAAGKQHVTDECYITSWNINMFKEGQLIKGDRSFVVYNKKTKCMVTTNNFPALREISLWLEDIYAILQATGMPTLRFVLKSRGFFHCIYSRCNEFQIYPKLICTDCGDEAAEWLCKYVEISKIYCRSTSDIICTLDTCEGIYRFLYCKNSDLRLGYSLNRVNCIRTYWQPWIGDDMLCLGVMSDEHSLGPFISVLNSENTPQVPREDLSEALEIYDPLDMICPTIVIFAHNMYTDKIWKWIKIGDVIIKNSKSIIVQSSLASVTFCMMAQNKRKRLQAKSRENDIKTRECKLQGFTNHTLSKNVKNHKRHQSSKWVKIGKVTNLHAYPLVSGRPSAVEECQVKFEGMYMFKYGKLINWDRAFVVYNMNTKCIMTTSNFPSLHEVNLSIEDNYIMLQAAEMPTLCIKLNDNEIIECTYWCCENIPLPKFVCSDCGDEAAQWLSNVLISPVPYDNITDILKMFEPGEIICPNIVIMTSNIIMEKKWEWIKIGNVIIKNTQQLVWSRKSPKIAYMKLFGLGFNCELYHTGCVKLNDNVYLHIADDESIEENKIEDIKIKKKST
ncbi:hypothetical protein EAI_05365 [Harpegnathos saltator]|uniref:Molybdenum cofactor sulfurase middle domain-containing protein n=1 Tax=Harpegnathos saltator TaxID=610380 RepID=E2BMW6_HARSA|nr:hypothetical protein EAI_05365 [Harpegnathos saltator]